MRESNPLQLTGQGSGPLEVRWLSPASTGCRPARQLVYGALWRPRLIWGCYLSPDPLTALSDSLMSWEGYAESAVNRRPRFVRAARHF